MFEFFTFSKRIFNLEQGLKSMSQIVEQLQSAIDEVVAKAAAEKAQVNAAVSALQNSVEALKEQVAALEGQANPDISGVLTAIGELGVEIENIYVEPEIVVPEVEEVEELEAQTETEVIAE